MATARELKNKIRSVANTKKITRTMEMISTAKAVVCKKRIEATQPYGDKLAEILRDLGGAGGRSESGSFPLLRIPEQVHREALFIVTANRGLCGGYNSNVLKMAENFTVQRNSEGVEIDSYVVGKKGITRFKYRGKETAASYTCFEDRPTFEEAEEVISPVMASFEKGEIDGLTVIFTHYESASRQKPVIRKLLPISADDSEGSSSSRREFILEPSPELILGRLLPLSLKMQFFQALVEAAACEQIARRIAMKNATDNAEEMSKTYTQLYNRTRQGAITQEILEVIAGAEVMS
ncbi:MAG: ATP synthase F1 subunit gamma [Planctomycetota bacterium]|nr:MAG: ATP synthase F1 subunit gamma [Planctomycetota bacterium]HIC22987.1 ATP synthase F1 subunit gamma [Planctomycetota bacterium]